MVAAKFYICTIDFFQDNFLMRQGYYAMGCHRMNKQRYSQNSIKVSEDLKRKKGIKVLVSLTGFLILMNLLPLVGDIVVQGRDTYVPASPFGPVYGFVGVEYEYLIYSANNNAYWMFDWGDGTTGDWVSLSESSNVITQSHTW